MVRIPSDKLQVCHVIRFKRKLKYVRHLKKNIMCHLTCILNLNVLIPKKVILDFFIKHII